jgi:hypothetical protein
MNKFRLTRSALFVLVITATVLSLLQVSASAAGRERIYSEEELAACAGLACNDPSDCGSFCFCNNPTDTTGKCYKDEATIEAFLKQQAMRKAGPARRSPQVH